MKTVVYRPGAPMTVEGLGDIPGPIDRVVEDGVIYLVDPRRAGESYGSVVCVTHDQAVELAMPEEPEPEPPVRGAAKAAAILGVSRDTVDGYLRKVPLDALPAAARPIRWGTGRQRRTEWDSPEQVRAWWREVTQVSPTPTRATPKPRKPRKRPKQVDLKEVIRDLTREDEP